MQIKKDALWMRGKLNSGERIFGSHVFCGTPMLTEAMALAGFDAIWIDMEHTAIGKEKVLNNLIASRAGGAATLVRIPWNDPVQAKPILDMGPDAMLFPYIRSAHEARMAAASCLYPPKGIRGYGPQRAQEYGRIDQIDYVDHLNTDMLRMIQIEHIDAIRALDEIIDVEEIDAFIVGPNDLAGSAGHMGRPDTPEMQPLYDEIARKLTKAGRPFGISMPYAPERLRQWIERGAQLLFCGYDTGYVYEGAKAVYDNIARMDAQYPAKHL